MSTALTTPLRDRLRDRAVVLGLFLVASTTLGMLAAPPAANSAPSSISGVHAR